MSVAQKVTPADTVTVSVQLFCLPRDDLTKVLAGINHLITEKMAKLHINITLKLCQEAKNIDNSKPAIVLCFNTSRLGTDLIRALYGITASALKAVVVIHHKEERVLPGQASKDILTDPYYRSLGGIFDMAFLSGRGFYSCEMNSNAVNAIAIFIKTHL